MAEITVTKTIDSIKRAASSRNGNPRFTVTFTDGSTHSTAVDAMVAYGIENSEYRNVPLDVTLENGHIVYVKVK